MTYVALNQTCARRASIPNALGVGSLFVLALGSGCAPHASEPSDEDCGAGACIPAESELRVMSVTPSDGATDIEPRVTITIRFNRDVDPTSVFAENVEVLDGDTPLSGTIDSEGSHVTFTPDAKLSLLGQYSVVVRSTVRDRYGVTMKHDFMSCFTVRDGAWSLTPPPSASPAWLSGLTVDTDGQFVLGLWEGPPTARRYSKKDAWSEVTPVACTMCSDYQLRGNARGQALAIAIEPDGRATARQLRARDWQSKSIHVATLTGYLPQALVTAAVAPNGEAHLLFVDDHVIRTRQTNRDGVWAEELGFPLTDTIYFRPVLAFDDRGTGFAAWMGYDEGDDCSSVHIIHFDASSASSVQSIPSSCAQGQAVGQVAVAMTTTGEAVLLWPGSGGLLTSSYRSGAWSAASVLAELGSGSVCASPTIVSDGDDLVAAWGEQGAESERCSLYSSRWHDGLWETRHPHGLITGSGPGAPLLARDPRGNLMLAWNRDALLTFARFNRMTQSWTAAATQFETADSSTRAIAVAGNGVVMTAFEQDGNTLTALFE